MFPILFRIGPFTLHTYGFMVAAGFLAALRVARLQFERTDLPDYLLDRLVFYLMISGLVGARFFYFAVDNFSELRVDPWAFFRVWEGGLVFYGGVLGGLTTLTLFSVVHRLPFLVLTDVFAAPLLLGQAIGRLGCFTAGCCYGKPTRFFLGVTFTNPESLAPRFVAIHPTQLYESAGDFLLFLIAMRLSKKPHRVGAQSAYYLCAYGAFRFLVEFLRGDDRGAFHWGLSPSQLIGGLMVAVGIGLFFSSMEN